MACYKDVYIYICVYMNANVKEEQENNIGRCN